MLRGQTVEFVARSLVYDDLVRYGVFESDDAVARDGFAAVGYDKGRGLLIVILLVGLFLLLCRVGIVIRIIVVALDKESPEFEQFVLGVRLDHVADSVVLS